MRDIVPRVYGGITWSPRPGLDLDAGIRVKRDLVAARPDTIVRAWINQYGAPNRYIRSFVSARPDIVFDIATAHASRYGPGWGITPRDPNVMFWPQNPGIKKERGT